MQWMNIPAELRERTQWVCCGDNKIPINPRTNTPADPTDPKTWATFAECVSANFPHIGYVLHKDDPYSFIDLDDKPDKPAPPEDLERFQRIIAAFDTYTERSASGRGYHLIVRGKVGKGARRGRVEVYSQERFLICTGDITEIPPKSINDRQELLSQLYAEVSADAFRVTPLPDVDNAEELTDAEVHAKALGAENGYKYDMLTRDAHSWQDGGYPSQSEADLALIGILTFYTKSNTQVRRMFRASHLGQRQKANRDDYVDRMIARMRHNLAERALPPVHYEFNPPFVPGPATVATGVEYPPGVVGELADYLYSIAVRPVREIALVTALALLAGIAGRAYNTRTGAGLNLYLIVLAKTGCGKEAMSTGMQRVVSQLRTQVPAIDEFIGPATFASGQGLIRTLSERPCMAAFVGEVGLYLQAMSDRRASSNDQMLLRILLDVYGKSGAGNVLNSTAYSDREKNTKRVESPSLTILGESVPESYYAGLSVEQIASGLIPRFLVLEYPGDRPDLNEATDRTLPPHLLHRLSDIASYCLGAAANKSHYAVPVAADALHVLKAFDLECDEQIRNADADVARQLANRAHLNAYKLATLLAVADAPSAPTVAAPHAEWAVRFVRACVQGVVGRFARGEVGHDQGDVHLDAAIVAYCQMTAQQRRDNGASTGAANAEHPVMQEKYFYTRLRLRQPYKSSNLGAREAIRRALDDYVRQDRLQLVDAQTAREQYGARNGRHYVLGPEFGS